MHLQSGMKLDGWKVETWYRYQRNTSDGTEQRFPSLHSQPSQNRELTSVPVLLMMHPDHPYRAFIITEEDSQIIRD